MMGLDIEFLLRNYSDFGGVVTANQRKQCKNGKLYVLNSKPFPGQHWLGLDLRKDFHCEFFDSFGHNLDEYGFEEISGPVMTYNTISLQHLKSDVCGAYCVMYAVYKLEGYTLADFLKNFNEHYTLENDKRVLEWLSEFDGHMPRL